MSHDDRKFVQVDTAVVKAVVVRNAFMDTVYVLILPVTDLGNGALLMKASQGECVGQLCMN